MLNILKRKFETSGRYTPRYIAEEKKNVSLIWIFYRVIICLQKKRDLKLIDFSSNLQLKFLYK